MMETEEDRKGYLEGLGAGVSSVLPKITVAGYQVLQLIYFFTGGPDEVRAWTIRVSILQLYLQLSLL
jgi:obg-like ATPase 1